MSEEVKPNKEWETIRDECISGGGLTDDCNLVAASQGKAQLEVVYQKLSCGCILVPVEADEVLL